MNKIQQALISLLNASIRGQFPARTDLVSEEWKQLFIEAKAHEVHLIIYPACKQLMSTSECNTALLNQWKKLAMATSLYLNSRLAGMKALLQAFNEAKIPVMVLKGLYLRNLYQQPAFRTMGDVDLLVKPEDLERAAEVIKSFGYIKTDDKDTPKHISFSHDQYIGIELHFSLVTVENRKKASAFNQVIWEGAQTKKIDGVDFLLPSDPDHILFCCLHMTNHMDNGGFGLRQLCDFVLMIENAQDSLDWEALTHQAYQLGIGRFVEAVLMVCHRLFSLDIPGAVINKLSGHEDYINLLIDEILISGVFGKKSVEWSVNRSLARYIQEDGQCVNPFLRYVFPPRNQLDKTYAYAKKYAILIPVAWAHRLLLNLLRKDLSLTGKKPDTAKIRNHIKLVNWLEIK